MTLERAEAEGAGVERAGAGAAFAAGVVLSARAKQAVRRLRWAEALRSGTQVAPWSIGGAGALLLGAKAVFSEPFWDASAAVVSAGGVTVALAPLVATTLAAWLRRRGREEGARALDRHYGLSERVETALAFGALPASERTAFMALAMDDALRVAPELRAEEAVPLGRPRGRSLAACAGALALFVAALAWRPGVAAPPAPAVVAEAKPEPVELITADEALALQARLSELALATPATGEAALTAEVAEVNRVLDGLLRQALAPEEAFRALERLEQALRMGADAEQEERARRAGLERTAKALAETRAARSVAKALDEARLADAAAELKKLPEALGKLSASERTQRRQELAAAFARASEERAAALRRVEGKRAELEVKRKRLLQKKSAGATDATGGASLEREAAETDRQLERLRRQLEELTSEASALSELDRQLAEAAAALRREAGDAAAFEPTARELERMELRRATDEQKRQLLERLEELRERLRQSGPNARSQLDRLRDFARRAGRGGAGKRSEGARGGSGESRAAALTVVPRPGGSGSGEAQAQPGSGAPGDTPDANLMGAPEAPLTPQDELHLAGQETGAPGTASAEVIAGAARRGFVSRDYARIFREYRTVAEEAIARDAIPQGMRLTVRRYFDLLRPSAGAPPPTAAPAPAPAPEAAPHDGAR